MIAIALRSSAGVANPRLMPVVMMPVPSGFVRTSASPGRAFALVIMRRGDTMPVTAKPKIGSGVLMVCPPMQHALGLFDLFRAATQDLIHHVERHRIGRHPGQI